MKVYTSADGLASSVIHYVARDSKGFIWFCARGGLSRFDGYEFTSYRLGNEQTSLLVHYFLETRDGTFWIATDSGLYRIKPQEKLEVKPATETFRKGERRLNAAKVSNQSFWTLFEDGQGRLWGGLNSLFLIENRDAEQITFREIDFNLTAIKEERSAVRAFTQSTDGSIWVAFDLGYLRILPDGRFLSYEVPRVTITDAAYSIREDSKSRIWLTHNTGVFVLKPEPLESLAKVKNHTVFYLPTEEQEVKSFGAVSFPTDSRKFLKLKFRDSKTKQTVRLNQFATPIAQDLYRAKDEKIWLPTIEGIYIFEGENYHRLRDSNSLPGVAKGIVEDLQGNLWFGTFGGAVKYTNSGLITYDQSSGLNDATIHSIQSSPNGDLLVFHGNWRISRFTKEGFESIELKLPSNVRYSWTSFPLFQDKSGITWALTTSGLYRFPQTPFASLGNQPAKNFSVPEVFPNNKSFYRAFFDSKNNIWFSTRGTQENSLFYYNLQTGEWKDYTNVEGYPTGSSVDSFAEDKAGNLWFSFYGRGGLFKYSNNRFTEITSAEGLPKGPIFALHVDQKGRLWIGSTGDGMARVDNPDAVKLEFVHYTENDGLASNNVRCLAEDLDGKIYAGTVRGVSRINPETARIRNFTTADGLATDFVHAAYRDDHGVMWFGTANGLSKLEPIKETAPSIPTIFISDLQIAGINYALSELGQLNVGGIDVSSSDNNLSINFFSVGEAGTLRYQYKLDGAGSDWSEPSEQRSVNFANLSPGSYRFLVRVINDANAVSENPAMVSFTIRPPFWRTWWFIALVTFLIAAGIFTLDRYRVSKTRQVETALTKSKESEKRFRTLADTASDAILTIDEDSNIIFVNQAIERVFGYTPDELIGQKMTMLMPERMRGGHNAGITRYLKTGQKNIVWEGVSLPGLHKEGYEIPMEVSFGEFEREGKRYFTGIARDVSERKRAEEALRRSREERMAEIERVRVRIATDLHDDIGSSLTQIAVLSEVARREASDTSETLSTPLERISSVSKELVAVMSDVVWAINPRKDNLHDLVQRMRRFASDIFSGRGIKFEFHAPDVESKLQLGANIRREVFAIFKESVNNCVKYSECSRVKINFQIENDWLILQVNDDGKGFDAAYVLNDNFSPEKGGNGLVNMRRRARELGGQCEITSQQGNGTNITLKIPLHNQSTDGNEQLLPAQTGGDTNGKSGL